MKIELKNIKHAVFASQETDCFEASVYIDGKKEGAVSNEGFGGPNRYHPNSLHTKINDYAKLLPQKDVSYIFDDGKTHMMEQDADGLIHEQFQKYLDKKLCSNKILYRIPTYQYKEGEYHSIKGKFNQEIKAKLVAKHGETIFILNEQV